jgi:dCMP deaminase
VTQMRLPRPSKHDYFIKMAKLAATRSTCPRRAVGSVIVDKAGRVLSTGYNGVASGRSHCIDVPCPGALDLTGDNSRCEAIHAETNAIIWCSNIRYAWRMYSTVSPCFNCCKLICTTPIKDVIVDAVYEGDCNGIRMLIDSGIDLMVFRQVNNQEILVHYDNL